ncbi:hypothetical protein [Bradyrhizobium sp. NP1]|uniref:hypothetical protein n=1 Tax=Bradyrhizobium sp. NP1 TaxID=3049772 RepID=UPI0025A5FC52|nr:hypothetical protein [Bradyrhizobium sp. NP1]WJR80591.1 hypothetical protein QOU61_12770 [Bradyrhizobium sp. NP1]
MADAPKSDADYVEAAYADAIQLLYKQLFTGIDTQPANEKEFLAHFTTGLAAARRAKELGLGALKPQISPTAIAEITVQKTRRKPRSR